MAADNQRRRGLLAFAVCVHYLEESGWTRDGDDMGVWLRPGFAMPLGDALTVQLEHDGVSLSGIPGARVSPGGGTAP